MNRRNFVSGIFIGIASLFGGVAYAEPRWIDRRTPRQRRKQEHPKRNAFRGMDVRTAPQARKDDALQTLMDIEGLT